MGRIWTKVGYRRHVQIGKQRILVSHKSLLGKQTLVATFIENTNSMLLKHQTGILNCWKKHFCEFLNPVTVQHMETSEEQIGETIYLTEVEVRTTIKSLKASKAPGEDDI